MSGARGKGLSLAEAIDVDDSSGSDDIPVAQGPPTRVRENHVYREPTRIGSDSPPSDTPIITSSHIRSTPTVAQRGREIPFAQRSATRQRIQAALQPDSSASSRAGMNVVSAPGQGVPPLQTSRRTNGRPPQRLRSAQQPGHRSAAAAATSNHPPNLLPNNPRTFRIPPDHPANRLTGTYTRASPRSAASRQPGVHYETVMQQLITVRPIGTEIHSLPAGSHLAGAPRFDATSSLWKEELSMARAAMLAVWDSQQANSMIKLALAYSLRLQFRYVKPVPTSQVPMGQSCQIVLSVEADVGSDVYDFFSLVLKPQMQARLNYVNNSLSTGSLPSPIQDDHYKLLDIFIQAVQTREAQIRENTSTGVILDSPARETPTQPKASLPQRALSTLSSLANSFGIPLGAGSSSDAFTNVIGQAFRGGDPSASPSFPAHTNLTGMDFDMLDDDERLLSVLEGDRFDGNNEPMDADMQEILSSMADGNFHGSDALATLYGDSGVDVAKLPLYSDTDSLRRRGLKTELHGHQLQGLQWMIKAEHRRVSTTEGTIRGLWQTRKDGSGRPYYFNVATRKCQRAAPRLPRGGINSDSMGLGKTIQIIASCLADRNFVPSGIKPVMSTELQATGSQAQAGPSSEVKKDEGKGDGEDSEEDYRSEGEEEEGVPMGMQEQRQSSLKSSDSSDTEEESESGGEQGRLKKRVKETHRPTDSEGMAMKSGGESESESETEEEKPVLRQRNARITVDSDDDEGESRRKRKKTTAKGVEADKGDSKGEKQFNETTLVICPLSVLQNWTGQVDQHCDRTKVSYYAYHGDQSKRVRTKATFASFLSKFNFVFTTYDTVRLEYRVIQKREEARRKAAEEKGKREEASFASSDDEAARQKTGSRKGKTRETGRAGKEESGDESDYKPEDEDEDGKPGRWYNSDDSFLAEEEEPKKAREEARDTPLFHVQWRRIVLDEAHQCRNPRTNVYTAICQLQAQRRWAVTGTPIVNSTKDLGALAAWCGLQPFADNPKVWSLLIERQLKRESTSERAAGLLRRIVANICLRRHKSMKNAQGEPIVKLPEVKFYKHTVPLTAADRDYYVKCEMACREHLGRWMREGNVNEHRSAILLFLLRLRQMSCHRRLIGSQLLEEIQNKDWDSVDKGRAEGTTIELTQEAIEALQEKLKVHVEMNDDCPVCMETLCGKSPVITPCGHPFCKACLSAIINSQAHLGPPKCPMDRLPLSGIEGMIELPIEGTAAMDDEVEEDLGGERTSAKVRECLKIVRATLKKDPTEKILVFSNFVKFLNIIGEDLKESGISHARFNGELNVKRRDAVLQSFTQPITPRQGVSVRRTVVRWEERLQRESAAQKAAMDAMEAGDPSTASSASTSSKTSSSLVDKLRLIDYDVGKEPGSATKKGKQREQDNDVVGDNPSVLLISMGCGALGLNLTAASSVLLMDPWWQSSVEQQALDRTHRIGQTRDVKVFQIICENTVEARVLAIQATKEGLVETAFSGIRATGSASDRREKQETSMRDLGRLFGMADDTVTQLSQAAPSRA